MTEYREDHVMRLRRELGQRVERLSGALKGPEGIIRGVKCVRIDPVEIRLAVDDFKVILAEIRRLK